jgi:LDH2 family malate/lactate/ureidoglycolate dehydrogenase
VNSSDADLAAEVLVRTDLRGITSHGVRMLPNYIKRLRAGGIDPAGKLEVVRESDTTAVIDGHGGIGHVIAHKSTTLAMTKAEKAGVAAVMVRGSNHLGAAGHYALMCAERGLIGIIYSNVPPAMTVTGGRGRIIGNAPTAWGIPNDGPPVVVDMAMSVVAGNRVRMAAERHEPIPSGWIIDEMGRATTDATAWLRGGALLPVGDHKGYGLALVSELLAGALAGAQMASEILASGQDARNANVRWNIGHAIVVLSVVAFMDLADFRARAGRLISQIQGSDKAPGVKRIYFPGELEAESEARGREHGITIDSVSWRSLVEMADSLQLGDDLDATLAG